MTILSLRRPDWQVEYGKDHAPAAAAATRRRIAAELATSGTAFLAYHVPAQGAGFVQAEGDAFRLDAAEIRRHGVAGPGWRRRARHRSDGSRTSG